MVVIATKLSVKQSGLVKRAVPATGLVPHVSVQETGVIALEGDSVVCDQANSPDRPVSSGDIVVIGFLVSRMGQEKLSRRISWLTRCFSLYWSP